MEQRSTMKQTDLFVTGKDDSIQFSSEEDKLLQLGKLLPKLERPLCETYYNAKKLPSDIKIDKQQFLTLLNRASVESRDSGYAEGVVYGFIDAAVFSNDCDMDKVKQLLYVKYGLSEEQANRHIEIYYKKRGLEP